MCLSPSGSGEVGAGGWLRVPLRERASDRPELHPPAHTHLALHLWGRWLERLLLVHRARGRSSGGTTHTDTQSVPGSSAEQKHSCFILALSAVFPVWRLVCLLSEDMKRGKLQNWKVFRLLTASLMISHWSLWEIQSWEGTVIGTLCIEEAIIKQESQTCVCAG